MEAGVAEAAAEELELVELELAAAAELELVAAQAVGVRAAVAPRLIG